MSGVWATKPVTLENLTGKTFAETLEVIEFAGRATNNEPRYKVSCNRCGLRTIMATKAIRALQYCPDFACRTGKVMKPEAPLEDTYPVQGLEKQPTPEPVKTEPVQVKPKPHDRDYARYVRACWSWEYTDDQICSLELWTKIPAPIKERIMRKVEEQEKRK
jgi:hypothetical protein